MPHYSLMSFMQDVVEEDIKHCEISKDLFISDFDFNSEIVMFPFTNRNTLLMTYSTNFTNFFSKKKLPDKRLTFPDSLFYSIRINDQWRIVFSFKNEGADNVRITDYH